MKVVMVIQNFFPSIGGAERQAMTLARELVKKDVAVTVLTQRNGRAASTELVDGVRICRLGANPLSFMVKTFFWLIAYRDDFDVIHAHIGSSHAVAAALAGRLLGKKTIVKLSGSSIVGEIPVSKKSFVGRFKLRAFSWLKPEFVLVSPEQKQDLHGYGLESINTYAIPNGVDTEKFQPASSSEKLALREKLAWTGVIFLFVGRFSSDKLRLDIFKNVLSAWSRLKKEQAAASFYLVGSGQLESAYRDEIESLGLANSVHLCPANENVRDLYRAADVFVLPSITEGLSNALLEAMACGLPVVGSRVTGIQELIRDSVQGRLFNPFAVDEIAAAFSSVAQDPQACERMGSANVQLAHKFSIQNSVSRHLALYGAA